MVYGARSRWRRCDNEAEPVSVTPLVAVDPAIVSAASALEYGGNSQKGSIEND